MELHYVSAYSCALSLSHSRSQLFIFGDIVQLLGQMQSIQPTGDSIINFVANGIHSRCHIAQNEENIFVVRISQCEDE